MAFVLQLDEFLICDFKQKIHYILAWNALFFIRI